MFQLYKRTFIYQNRVKNYINYHINLIIITIILPLDDLTGI